MRFRSWGFTDFLGKPVVGLISLVLFWASPGYTKEDSLSFLTLINPSYLTQAFQASKHFMTSDEGDSPFERRITEEGDEEPKIWHRLPLSWNIGAAYNLTSASPSTAVPKVTDHMIAWTVGLGWEVSSNLEMSLGVTVDYIPAESYKYGNFHYRIQYTLPLSHVLNRSRNPASTTGQNPKFSPNSMDASEFYRREREEKFFQLTRKIAKVQNEEEDEDEDEEGGNLKPKQYPNFKFAYNLGAGRHTIEAKIFTRRPELGSVQQDSTLNQFLNGPEISFSPNEKVTFRVSGNYHLYSGSVDQFASLLETGSIVKQSGFTSESPSGLTDPFLSFPSFSFEQAIDWHFKATASLSLVVREVNYASTGQSGTLSFNPVYYRDLNKNWNLGVGASILTGPNTPSSLIGSIELIRRL